MSGLRNDDDFKLNAVLRVLAGYGSVDEVAVELSIGASTLYRWKRELEPTVNDVDVADYIAGEEGVNRYDVLVEKLGWSTEQVLETFGDMYSEDSELDNFRGEWNSCCTNEELGLDEDGQREDA